MDSILDSVKKVVGIDPSYEVFDVDLMMHINTAFFVLNQLGVGPEEGYRITGREDLWSDYLGSKITLESVKSYVYVTVRLAFDRPETSYGIQALERMKDEWAWRLEVQHREDLV